jgi:uncharacterized protein (DUF2384 family)
MEQAKSLKDIYDLMGPINEATDLYDLVDKVFKDHNSALDWFNAPVKMLEDKTPYEKIIQEDYESVIGVLAGLYSGAFL